jgi:L-erythro-3,5-diaminohexanoate dehydrogenase
VVDRYVATRSQSDPLDERGVTVAVIGGAGKSGSLSLAAAKAAGADRTIGVVPHQAEADLLSGAGIADAVAIADARDRSPCAMP